MAETTTKPRGFAAMVQTAAGREMQRRIASDGGRKAHTDGNGHEWTSAEARIAGRAGGTASRGGRGKLPAADAKP